MTNKIQIINTKSQIKSAIFLISIILFILTIPITYAESVKTVDDIYIKYTGGQNNIERFLPKDFRNKTYNAKGELTLPGTSIEIMSLENRKYIMNIKKSIDILEYIRNSVGFEKASEDESILNIELYDPNIDQDILSFESKNKKEEWDDYIDRNNPTLEDILKNPRYIDPVYDGNIKTLTEPFLDDALQDLKEHTSEGAVDNFLYTFTKFNLLIIETMAIFFLVYGGLVWVTASGDDTQVEKGKNIILWAIVGIVGGLVSYVVLNIVIQIFTS